MPNQCKLFVDKDLSQQVTHSDSSVLHQTAPMWYRRKVMDTPSKLDLVAQAWDPRRPRPEDSKFKATLNNLIRAH